MRMKKLVFGVVVIVLMSVVVYSAFAQFMNLRRMYRNLALFESVKLLMDNYHERLIKLRMTEPGHIYVDNIGTRYTWTAEMAEDLEAEIARIESLRFALGADIQAQ